jgi:hypothetical protein
VLFENGWTSTQSCGVGWGEGDGVGEGVGLGVGLGVGVGLSLAVGVTLGFGLVDGVGLAGSVALGDGLTLGLALADWLGVAETELSGTSASASASARPADLAFLEMLEVTAGRWAHVVVALSSLAREVCARAAPPAPLDTRSKPAMMLNVAVWVRPVAVIETLSLRCRPRLGCRTALPYLIAVRMSRLTYSLLAPFDTYWAGRGHGPRGKLYPNFAKNDKQPADHLFGALLRTAAAIGTCLG